MVHGLPTTISSLFLVLPRHLGGGYDWIDRVKQNCAAAEISHEFQFH